MFSQNRPWIEQCDTEHIMEVKYKCNLENYGSDQVDVFIQNNNIVVRALHLSENDRHHFQSQISLPNGIDRNSLRYSVENNEAIAILQFISMGDAENWRRETERQRAREKERERERQDEERRCREMERERERERERQRYRENERKREAEREKERERERQWETERQRGSERGREREREWSWQSGKWKR